MSATKDRYVEVVDDDSGDVVWRTGPYYEWYATKIARGRRINLDDKYTVNVEQSDSALEAI